MEGFKVLGKVKGGQEGERSGGQWRRKRWKRWKRGEEVKCQHIETQDERQIEPRNYPIMVHSGVTVDKGYGLTNLHSVPGTHGKEEGELTPERCPLTSPCEMGQCPPPVIMQ